MVSVYPNGGPYGTPHSAGRNIPSAPMPTFPGELTRLTQWVGGRLESRRNPDDTITNTKVPYSPITGKRAAIDAPHTWGSLPQAWGMVQSGQAEFLMLAFVDDGGLVFTDLDDCRVPETGDIEPWAMEIIEAQGTFAEASISGTGAHTIGRAKKPGDRCRSWKHDQGGQIEIYERGRFAVMTGNVLPGYESIRDTQAHLDTFYQTHWADHQPAPRSRQADVFSTGDHTNEEILETAYRMPAGPKIRSLFEGDILEFASPSEARMSLLTHLACFTQNADQLASLLEMSGFWSVKLEKRPTLVRDEVQKGIENRPYSYDWNWSSCPRLIAVDGLRIDQAVPDDAGIEYWKDRALKAEEHALECDKQIIYLQDRINVQLVRIQRADEREAILTNTKLGAPRQTLTALHTIFKDEAPKETSPDPDYRWRVPLARLAERTGLSPDACSRHLHKAKTYRTEEGEPVLRVETFDIPRTVNQETGEIIEPHKELWASPAVPHEEFGRILATLEPKAAPKHGGAPDRNVCPDHPDAGTVRRSKTIRRITRECAHCKKVLDSTDIEIGSEERTYLPPTRHDAFSADSDSARPTPHDAASTNNHTPYNLPRIMPDRSEAFEPPTKSACRGCGQPSEGMNEWCRSCKAERYAS